MVSPSVISSWSPSVSNQHSPAVLDVDNSVLIHRPDSGPPSSPFVSEIEPKSRAASHAWSTRSSEDAEMDGIDTSSREAFQTPLKSRGMSNLQNENNKENEKIQDDMFDLTTPAGKLKKGSPAKKFREIQREQRVNPREPQKSAGLEKTPPASTRRQRMTPKRTPLEILDKASNTPQTLRRIDSPRHSPSFATGPLPTGVDVMNAPALVPQDTTNIDDTCFSAFSEIPEMTLFAKVGQSPSKQIDALRTPRLGVSSTPRTGRKRASPSRSPSPTPRRMKTPASHVNSGDGTSFLIDFTQQIEDVGVHRGQPSTKPTTEPNLLSYINRQRSPHKSTRTVHATPQKQNNILNLLDFELPPAPTPRSIPTITVRELEGLKSSYLSQISSLRATLSGREAEVASLKQAVADAERRVGEAQEALGEEKNRRENVEQEKESWERRGKEFEAILSTVKEEVIKSEAEKEDMMQKSEDLERRAEDAEQRARKAEDRCNEALSARINGVDDTSENNPDSAEQVQRLVAIQIDSKIEAVSRELHAVYKEKHERKVATLKKSYEARGEKKCVELRDRVAALEHQNEELLAARDATFSGRLDNIAHDADLRAEVESHKASLARIEVELQTSREQQAQLLRDLEQERIEKGDLVAAVDEMLALQMDQGAGSAAASATHGAMSVVEDFRKSISISQARPSGLRTPAPSLGLGESRIGRAGSGLPKSSSGLPGPGTGLGKSRMLANIERMGARVGSGASSES